MEAFVSLRSADLMALGADVRRVEDLADGFHIDVLDGHNVPDLLFGPDLVTALRAHTSARIEVHLNVTDPAYWVGRFAAAGADIITVQSGPCGDVAAVLGQIRDCGCAAGLGIELHEPALSAVPHFGLAARLLLLGTPIGVKGRELDPATPGRITELVRARERSPYHPAIVVDGGIRRHTVPGWPPPGPTASSPAPWSSGRRIPARPWPRSRPWPPAAPRRPRDSGPGRAMRPAPCGPRHEARGMRAAA